MATETNPKLNEHILKIVGETLDGLEKNEPLSQIIRSSIRISTLRNDFKNLWWLEWELVELTSESSFVFIQEKVKPHFSVTDFVKLHSEYSQAWVDERSLSMLDKKTLKVENKCLAKSIPDIESLIETHAKADSMLTPPQGLHPVDLYFTARESQSVRLDLGLSINNAKTILGRIKTRVHAFLVETEKELIFGKINSDIFSDNQRYVETKLGELIPEALAKFNEAYKRMSENTNESRAHALTSCRRVLKEIADKLHPPSNDPVVGADGITRILKDDHYIGRLWQFMFDNMKKSTAAELLMKELNDFGARIDKLYELSCKGVHAEVDEFEVNQCVIKTFILVGDILRIKDKSSAIAT